MVVVGTLMLCCMCCVPRPGSKAAESAEEFLADAASVILPPDLAVYVVGAPTTQYRRMQQRQQKEVDL